MKCKHMIIFHVSGHFLSHCANEDTLVHLTLFSPFYYLKYSCTYRMCTPIPAVYFCTLLYAFYLIHTQIFECTQILMCLSTADV